MLAVVCRGGGRHGASAFGDPGYGGGGAGPRRDSGTCDPCPGPTLTASDLHTLGADVIDAGGDQPSQPGTIGLGGFRGRQSYVLTRLHYRYDEDILGDDLVFRPAGPIQGGRGTPSPDGAMLQGVGGGHANQFQARYAILHRWEGEVSCDEPRRGVWGGPPDGADRARETKTATDIAFAPRGGLDLEQLVAQPLASLGIAGAASGGAGASGGEAGEQADEATSGAGEGDDASTSKGGGGCGCAAAPHGRALPLLALVGLALL
ncbi:MAG: hypothetical protein ACOCUS_06060, partial [Polyangiales bacterium]